MIKKTDHFHQEFLKVMQYLKRLKRGDKIQLLENNLLPAPRSLEEVIGIDENDVDLIYNLKKAIGLKKSIRVHSKKDIVIEISPQRLTSIGDNICLIGEEVNEHYLSYIYIKSIEKIDENLGDYEVKYTTMEINNFIMGLRIINDNEMRVILKLKGEEKANFIHPYIHFHHPCVLTNYEGEYIWAATTELTETFLNWLHDLDSQIEILSPPELKNAFLKFKNN